MNEFCSKELLRRYRRKAWYVVFPTLGGTPIVSTFRAAEKYMSYVTKFRLIYDKGRWGVALQRESISRTIPIDILDIFNK